MRSQQMEMLEMTPLPDVSRDRNNQNRQSILPEISRDGNNQNRQSRLIQR